MERKLKSLNYKSIALIMLISLVVISLAGCGQATTTPAATTPANATAIQTTSPAVSMPSANTSAPSVTLNLSAASSLTDAIKEINALYIQSNPNVTLTSNFAGSGTLQKQIEQGAPADIFISAGATQMDTLVKENLIVTSTRKNLLNNILVMIVPNDSTLGLQVIKDLAGPKVSKIAIGDPKSVPAGTYAQLTFDELGITSQVTSKYVMGADVKSVLSYVESGNVDAGLVYLTDARTSSKVKIIDYAPADINSQIVYPAAVISGSKVSDAATKYENFLFSTQAKAIFEKYGFTIAKQ